MKHDSAPYSPHRSAPARKGGLPIGFRFDVTDDIYLNTQIEQNHESNPSGNSADNDVTYLIGAGIKLD